MTTSPEPTKGVPKHDGDSSFTPREDHNSLADWVRDNTGTSVANEAALPSTDNWVGRIVFVEAIDALFICTDLPGTWKRITPSRIASGTVAIAGTISISAPIHYSDSIVVNFPAGLFTAPPIVAFTYEGAGVGWADRGSIATTASGTSARAYRINASPSGNIAWTALQL